MQNAVVADPFDDSKLLQFTPVGRLDEGGLAQVLGYQLAQASIVAGAVFDAEVSKAYGLRPVEYTVLALVNRNPGLTAARLARALAVTPPNLTTWIERLSRRGLVERQTHHSDRRAMHIHATSEGAALVAQATERIFQGEARALAKLSLAERMMLLELLHKVAECRPSRGSAGNAPASAEEPGAQNA